MAQQKRYEVHALGFHPTVEQPLDWPHKRHHFFPIGPGLQWRRLGDLVAHLLEHRFDIAKVRLVDVRTPCAQLGLQGLAGSSAGVP